MKVTTYEFEEHGDDRGILIALEEYKNVPFNIRRCYYMYNTYYTFEIRYLKDILQYYKNTILEIELVVLKMK